MNSRRRAFESGRPVLFPPIPEGEIHPSGLPEAEIPQLLKRHRCGRRQVGRPVLPQDAVKKAAGDANGKKGGERLQASYLPLSAEEGKIEDGIGGEKNQPPSPPLCQIQRKQPHDSFPSLIRARPTNPGNRPPFEDKEQVFCRRPEGERTWMRSGHFSLPARRPCSSNETTIYVQSSRLALLPPPSGRPRRPTADQVPLKTENSCQ